MPACREGGNKWEPLPPCDESVKRVRYEVPGGANTKDSKIESKIADCKAILQLFERGKRTKAAEESSSFSDLSPLKDSRDSESTSASKPESSPLPDSLPWPDSPVLPDCSPMPDNPILPETSSVEDDYGSSVALSAEIVDPAWPRQLLDPAKPSLEILVRHPNEDQLRREIEQQLWADVESLIFHGWIQILTELIFWTGSI